MQMTYHCAAVLPLKLPNLLFFLGGGGEGWGLHLANLLGALVIPEAVVGTQRPNPYFLDAHVVGVFPSCHVSRNRKYIRASSFISGPTETSKMYPRIGISEKYSQKNEKEFFCLIFRKKLNLSVRGNYC